jgi:hypothetical protein
VNEAAISTGAARLSEGPSGVFALGGSRVLRVEEVGLDAAAIAVDSEIEQRFPGLGAYIGKHDVPVFMSKNGLAAGAPRDLRASADRIPVPPRLAQTVAFALGDDDIYQLDRTLDRHWRLRRVHHAQMRQRIEHSGSRRLHCGGLAVAPALDGHGISPTEAEELGGADSL